MSKEWDAIVIGAGPAGSSAAWEIASGGGEVLMLSKDSSPGMNKPCAGGLPLALARRLRLPAEVIEKRINGFLFTTPIEGMSARRYSHPKCVTVYRKVLDPLLCKRATDAGARLLNDTVADATAADEKGIQVRAYTGTKGISEYRGKVVIFADGVNSIANTKFQLGSRESAISRMNALVYEIEAPENTIDHFEVFCDGSLLPWGYFWVAPKRNRISVGVFTGKEKKDSIKSLLDSFLLKSQSLQGLRGKDVKKIMTGLVPLHVDRPKLFGNRMLVCGDAAGLVNPITCSGLPYAIRSGELAGATVAEAIRRNDFSRKLLSRYQERLFRTRHFLWIDWCRRRYRKAHELADKRRTDVYSKMQHKYFMILSSIGRFVRTM